MKIKFRILSVTCGLFGFFIGCAGSSTSKNDALSLCQTAIKEYCAEQKLSEADMKRISLTSDKPYDWVAEYRTVADINPKHILILSIKRGKIVERHRLIE